MTTNYRQAIRIIIKFFLFLELLSFVNRKFVMKLDNKINEPLYQNDIHFQKYQTEYKIIAIYYTNNYTNKTEISNNKIKEEIKLAKNHGIFGFGMIYNLGNGRINDEILHNTFSFFEEKHFPFFIIFNFDINPSIMNKSSLIQNLTNDYI